MPHPSGVRHNGNPAGRKETIMPQRKKVVVQMRRYFWEGNQVTIVRKVGGRCSIVRLLNGITFTAVNTELKRRAS